MLYSTEKLKELKRRWTTPNGKKLVRIIKDSRCYLSPVLFRKKIQNLPGLNDKGIKNSIDLRGISLSGFDFRVPVKEGDDGFSEEMAILSGIHFEGATLRHCNFEGGKIHDCFFENTELEHSDFKNASVNNCNFQQSDLTGINLQGAKLINCNFTDADIKDITMNTTIVDQKTTFGKILKSEKEKSYHFGSIEYKQIKEMYKNSSLHKEADTYHYKEMVAKRKIAKKGNPMRWMNYIFGDLLCKYGTSYVRVFMASLVVIFGAAWLFYLNDSLWFYNKDVTASFADSVYFSIGTFTTLGYGDYHAVDILRFVAVLESFLGAALMSLFTVIVARNIIRD